MSQERSTISLQWSPRSRHMDLHWTALAAQAEKQAKLMFPHEWQQALISYGLVLPPTSIGKPLALRSPHNQTTAMGSASPARSPRRLCTPRGSAASVHQDAQDKNLAALRDFLGPSLFQQRLRDLEIDLQYTVPHAVAQDYCRLMQQVEANVLTTGLTKSIVASAHNALRTPRAQSPSSSRTTTPRGSIPAFPHAQHGKLTALLQQCIRRNIGAFLQTEFAMAASLTRLGLRPEDLQHQSAGDDGERFQGTTPSSRTMVSKDHPDDDYTMLMGCSPVVPEGRRSIVSFAIPAEEGEENEATSPPRAVSRAGGGGGSPRSHVSPSRTLLVEPSDAATTVLPPWHAALVVAVKGVLDQRLGEEADDWPAVRFSKTVLLITSQVVSQPALLSTWKKDPHFDRKPKIARVVERLVDAAIQYEREKSQQKQQLPEENCSRVNGHTEEGVVDEHEDDMNADYQLHDGTVEQLVSSDVALENVFGENPFAVHCVDDDHHDDDSGDSSSPANNGRDEAHDDKEEVHADEDGEANLSPPSTVSNSPLRSTSQFLPQAATDDHNTSQTPQLVKKALLQQQERRSPSPTAHPSQQSEFDLLVQEVHRTLIGSPNVRQPKDDRLEDDNVNEATTSTATVEDGIAQMSRVLGVSLADNANQSEFRRQEETTTQMDETSINGNGLSSEQAEELRRELVTLEGQISLLHNRAAAVRQLLGITPL